MPRDYTVTFEKVSVDAVQDLFQIKGGSSVMVEIIGFNIDCADTAAPTDQQVAVRCRYLPATVTDGSGGSSPTPQKFDQGDSAAVFTAKANNTTQATTNGTAVIRWEGGFNIRAGIEKFFVSKPKIMSGQSFTV